MKWILNFFKKDKSKKDPEDYTTTELSTPWEREYYCDKCRKRVSNQDIISRICSYCNNYNEFGELRRRKRTIFDGTKWIVQYAYKIGWVDVYELVDKEF